MSDRFFERVDGGGNVRRIHPHHSALIAVAVADPKWREVTVAPVDGLRTDSDVIERVTEMLCELAELGYYRGKEIAEALAAAGLLVPAGAMWHTDPPTGWFTFGHHMDTSDVPGMEFWGNEFSDDGLPIWERPVPAPDADVAERIGAILREHQPTSGMQVASGVTCRCGYWTGEERPGVTRPVGYSGLAWHQAQMIATPPVAATGEGDDRG